eukprot:3491624-Pyramimonas_sp.AAC.1
MWSVRLNVEEEEVDPEEQAHAKGISGGLVVAHSIPPRELWFLASDSDEGGRRWHSMPLQLPRAWARRRVQKASLTLGFKLAYWPGPYQQNAEYDIQDGLHMV